MIKAKKEYGQNFLKNEAMLERIVESVPKDKNLILEIGPGLGDLTKRLVKTGQVLAYEIDTDLCPHLKKEFASEIKSGNLTLVCKDVLKDWEKSELLGQKYNLIANLPYYVATNIILRAIFDANCQNILVMIQKEVAEKFNAKSGEKEFSSLSILAQLFFEIEILFEVGPQNFEPAPKVDSAVISFRRKLENLSQNGIFEDKKELELFKNFLKSSFSAPRKTLLKNLSFYSKDRVSKIFLEFGFSQTIRPHEVGANEYLKLFKMLK